MQKFIQHLKAIPIIKKLNNYSFMFVIWWSLLIAILPYLFSLLKISSILRVGILFLIINSIISYHLGELIQIKQINKWWLLCLPVIFDLAVLTKFANYNFIFSVIYLIFELFGLMGKRIYR